MTTTEMTVSRRAIIAEPRRAEPSIGGAVRAGCAVIALALGAGLGWGFLAPLDSAAHAQGTVVVDGNRKTIQHLEGGIVAELAVRDGDTVAAGQTLLRLEGTQSRATLEELTAEQAAALVRMARLRAEYAGQRAFSVPRTVVDEVPAARRALAVQQQLFAARWTRHDGELAVLREQRLQAEREVTAHRAQERSAAEQIVFIEEELAGVLDLFNKGLERKMRVLSLKRAMADLTGTRDQARARALLAEQAVAVADVQLRAKETARLSDIAAEMEEAQNAQDQTAARLKAARDAVERTEIRAPVPGRVVGLTVFTVGGVVKPGEPLMDIVPDNGPPTIEARIDPLDIDVVKAGQTAQVRLSAFKPRRTPPIDATVLDVSADRLTDPTTHAPYFVARVRPLPGALEHLGPAALHPGMPADVLIATGQRRAIDYVLAPLQDAMAHALTED
ncbi:HlyD family type I secretion periplasmic adaptor subunit [Azospirillum isscasi]|uniref:Membrane fusion protein (MFP) family protein n=1 Tax=Azospirillum isscasi TaxID=3053926 RepID=A0ABU0WJC2_9PROT|nr:HlyD family type I secretion periplasmic adaptor subunit [Azospirillum isscasi]MDQ2104260.1 HlyD family type I secretion periplasmic adaptor subunit [Azospirillum isscasi]